MIHVIANKMESAVPPTSALGSFLASAREAEPELKETSCLTTPTCCLLIIRRQREANQSRLMKRPITQSQSYRMVIPSLSWTVSWAQQLRWRQPVCFLAPRCSWRGSRRAMPASWPLSTSRCERKKGETTNTKKTQKKVGGPLKTPILLALIRLCDKEARITNDH